MKISILSINGIGPAVAETLAGHQIKTVETLAALSVEELTQMPGFGPARAQRSIEEARAMLAQSTLDIREETIVAESTSEEPGKTEEPTSLKASADKDKKDKKKTKKDKKKTGKKKGEKSDKKGKKSKKSSKGKKKNKNKKSGKKKK